MKNKIFLSSPHMCGKEMEYIQEAFDTNWIAPLGANVIGLEKDLATYTGTKYVKVLTSGTGAMHLALKLVGAQEGDQVYCQSLTFSATCNPITYVNAIPVFIDSERDTWNMCPIALQKAIDTYGVPKAVIIVHLYGVPAKIDEITKICENYKIPLIEDAAEALGSTYKEKQCGSFGNYAILSFNGNKIITTSGGGALICDNEADAEKTLFWATQARDKAPHYEHTEIGYNYRMSNICAGIGRGQMTALDERVEKKNHIYQYYKEKLGDLLTFIEVPDHMKPNYWLTSALIPKERKQVPMDIINALAEDNIEARPLWKPMHKQPVFRDCFYTYDKEDVSADLFARGLCLPSDSKMTDEDLARVCGIVRGVFDV